MALSLCLLVGTAGAGSEVANGPTHEGVEVAIHLPLVDHVKNVGGIDGAGLCVWASLQMLANWMGIDELAGLFEHMKGQKGGGWPERVTRVMAELAPDVPYVQYEGDDPAFLEALLASGRPVAMTYGTGEFYRGETIAHMVVLAHLDANWGAIIDNNDPRKWTWMTRAELLRRAKHPTGKYWAVGLLCPPPPPPPTN